MKVKGLIFDVDGVIADTEAVNARASIAMFEELFGLKGVERQDFEAGLGRGAEAYVRAAASVHGIELSDAEVAMATEMRQEKFLLILAEEGLECFEGVMELMETALERADFRVAIATSGTREKSEAVLKATGVPYEKMVYISGEQVKNKKPAPDLFLRAAEEMEVEPSECVVIEDAPNGVASAKAAGCKCIAVTNSTTADKLSEADLVVESLSSIGVEDITKILRGS